MPVPDWAQMGLTVFGPGELNHLAPKLRMDSRDIRFPFGHSRPCQLTPLLACASSKTSAPLHGRGFFLSAWSFSAGSRYRRPALKLHALKKKPLPWRDRKSTRLNSSHGYISSA